MIGRKIIVEDKLLKELLFLEEIYNHFKEYDDKILYVVDWIISEVLFHQVIIRNIWKALRNEEKYYNYSC